MKVYIAGSSDEAEKRLVQGFRDVMIAKGHSITTDWTVCEGLKRECTQDEKRAFARNDWTGVATCDVFWLVAPPGPSEGASVELGIALHANKRAIVSGPFARRTQPQPGLPAKDRLFSELAEIFDTHEAALAAILDSAAPETIARTAKGKSA
jgi:hypothetical protein